MTLGGEGSSVGSGRHGIGVGAGQAAVNSITTSNAVIVLPIHCFFVRWYAWVVIVGSFRTAVNCDGCNIQKSHALLMSRFGVKL